MRISDWSSDVCSSDLRQENDADGVLWGALPLLYSNGERVEYPSSASTAAPWTYWNVHDQSAYGELAYATEGGWNAKARLTYNRRDSVANLLYAYGYPDAETGLGVSGVTGIYTSPSNQDRKRTRPHSCP